MLSVLDLFNLETPVWHPNLIAEKCGYTRATAYRYVKELVGAGLLQKVSPGAYALGPRVVELDYFVRQSDPVLLASVPIMDELARMSGFDCVLTAIAGDKVIDTYRAFSDLGLSLKYGRGRPRPRFRGAAPKVLLAFQSRPFLTRTYERNKTEIEESGLGMSWALFRKALKDIKDRACCVARAELEENLGGAAVPICPSGEEAVAALALVGPLEKFDTVGEAQLIEWLHEAAAAIAVGCQDEVARSQGG